MRKFNLSKSIAAVLSAALLAMSLTACGSTASTASTAASTASTEAAASTASTEAASEAAPSEAASAEATEVEEGSTEAADTEAVSDDVVDDEIDESNTDITAGSTDEEGYYSAYAYLNNAVDANVSALGADIKTSDFSASKAIGDTGSTAIKDARLKYLTAQNDGDEDAANDDLSDYEDIEAATDAQLTEIKNYGEDLGKLFDQFGITAYDLSSPYDSDSDYVEYDVYSSDGKLFLLDFYFTDGKLSTIDFNEEEE
ncbi:hypothetical protein QYZ88_017675 [Lachnospiraceae bacterium C1.1]|nr:hypothetical protein [Lachnospiraceae bacterium C1.1]